MILSRKFRVYPNRAQANALSAMLADFCGLYNAALQQRIEAWQRRRVSLNYGMQASELKAVRACETGLERWSFSAEQQVLRRLDKAFKAFFGRVKRGGAVGFPRFRASARHHAAEFRVGDGLTLRKNGRFGVVGVPGAIKVKWHREIGGDTKSAILTRQGGKWFLIFHIDIPCAEAREGESVGIDVGLSTLAALSNGELIERPNWTKRAAKGLRRRQRELARCMRGSKRRAKVKARLAAYQAGIGRRRTDMLHKLSAGLTARFASIAVEKLNIKGLARGMLAKHVNDAAWAQLVSMLIYKAAKAGGAIIEVDPRGTSQTCPECGTIAKKALDVRIHRCDCGCVLDRDVAAAMVVHFRAFGFWPGHGLKVLSGRVAA